MAAIGIDINEIVDQIDARRHQGKRREGHQGQAECRRVIDPDGCKQRNEHEYVLGPLMRPQCAEQGVQPIAGMRDVQRGVRHPGTAGRERQGGGDNPRFARQREHRQISAGIAGVVEAALAISLHETIALYPTSEVGLAIRTEHVGKQAHVLRDGMGHGGIGRRAQDHFALSPFRFEPLEQLVIERQQRRLQRLPARHLLFEGRLAARKPPQHTDHRSRGTQQEAEHRLVQGVHPHERPVEIDREGDPSAPRFAGRLHVNPRMRSRRAMSDCIRLSGSIVFRTSSNSGTLGYMA